MDYPQFKNALRTPYLWLALIAVAAGASAQDVPVVVARTSTVAASHRWDAVVQAVHQTTVSAQTQGRVQRLHVKAGERVRAGQVLAVLDDREVQAQVQRSQAQLAQAQAQWQEAQTQWQRAQSLQTQGFVSKAALDSAQTQVQAAQAGREQAQAGVRQAAVQQGFARIVAPYDGWVQQTHAQVGDLAVMGAPLVTMYAPQPLRVVVQVPASLRASAQEMQQFALATGNVVRTVRPVSSQWVPTADPVAQTQEWRLELAPQDSADLVPGQQVQLQAQAEAKKSDSARLSVPTSALVRRGELTAVYIQTERGFALRAVRTLGPTAGATVDIASGLREGDVVATDPVKAAAKR